MKVSLMEIVKRLENRKFFPKIKKRGYKALQTLNEINNKK